MKRSKEGAAERTTNSTCSFPIRGGVIFRSARLLPAQAAPLLATGWHNRGGGSPTEAFAFARRALSHLRSRVEEVCREEVEKISRAGAIGVTCPLSRLVVRILSRRVG